MPMYIPGQKNKFFNDVMDVFEDKHHGRHARIVQDGLGYLSEAKRAEELTGEDIYSDPLVVVFSKNVNNFKLNERAGEASGFVDGNKRNTLGAKLAAEAKKFGLDITQDTRNSDGKTSGTYDYKKNGQAVYTYVWEKIPHKEKEIYEVYLYVN